MASQSTLLIGRRRPGLRSQPCAAGWIRVPRGGYRVGVGWDGGLCVGL